MPTIPIDDNGCGHTAARHLGSTAPAIPRRGKGPDFLRKGANHGAAGCRAFGSTHFQRLHSGLYTPFAVAHSTRGRMLHSRCHTRHSRAMFRIRVTGGQSQHDDSAATLEAHQLN